MITVVITIVVMVLYKVYITNKINDKKIKELEQRLDEYYTRRENELLNKFRDIEQQDMNNNKELTKDIIEGITFILMTLSIIGLMCVLYEVNKVSKDIKVLKSMTIRKQNECKYNGY